MKANYIYRIQHPSDGRGPFRPGRSHEWIDAVGEAMRVTKPATIDEFGADLFNGAPSNMSYGTGVRNIYSLAEWFSSEERLTLASMGYQVVRLDIDLVVRESTHQVVFGRRTPLRERATVLGWRHLG